MQFRKLAALAGSALMGSLAAVAPAFAATNVSGIYDMVSATNYPVFVVGAAAQPADVAGAIGVAAKMAAFSVEEKSVSVTTAAAGADGSTFRMEILNTTAKTRDFDVSTTPFLIQAPAYGGRTASFLQSGSLTIGGTEYKYYEVIGLNGANSAAATGFYLTTGDKSNSGTYEAWYKDIGVQVPANAVFYQLRFETDIPVGSGNLTGKTIKFLGKDYIVTSSTTTEVKLSQSGGTVLLNSGDTKTIGDYTVELGNVGTGTNNAILAAINVNGVDVTVQSGQTEYVTVGGKSVPVLVKSAAVVSTGGWAEVLVGATAYKIIDGALEKPNDLWYGNIGKGATSNTVRNITLTLAQGRTGFTGDYPALTTGAQINSPEGLFQLKFAGLESTSAHKVTITPSTGDFNGNGVYAESGIKIAATDPVSGAAAKVIDTGAGFADTVVYDVSNGAWVYQNSTSGWTSSSRPTIQLTDGILNFSIWNTTGSETNVNNNNLVLMVGEPDLTESGNIASDWYLEYDFDTNATLGTFANVSNSLGTNTSDTDYLSYGTGAPATSVAYGGTTPRSRSGGFASAYGTALVSASQNGVSLQVPKSQLYGDLVFGRETSAAGGAVTTKEPVEVTADVAMLDTEVTDAVKTGSDLIVVGGPCVNKLAAELMGKTYPACGESSGLTSGTALIKVFPDAFATGKTAVLIAGWEAADTDLATRVIQVKQTEIKAQNVPAVTVSGTIASPTIAAA